MAYTIHTSTVERLEHIPLVQVMHMCGKTAVYKKKKTYTYHCPFHTDDNASFEVEYNAPMGKLPGWRCYSCKEQGTGAISLAAALLGLDMKKDFVKVCKELARMFNMSLVSEEGEVEWMNGFFHRAKQVPGQEHFSYIYKDVCAFDLEVLGCRNAPVRVPVSVNDAEVEVQYAGTRKYSWGKDFGATWCGENFNLKCVEDIFDYKSVENYTLPAGKDNKSWQVESSDYYPIGVFEYANENGELYWKKYEPLAYKSDGKVSKFTWWGALPDKLQAMMWGDYDFNQAWRNGECNVNDRRDTDGGTDPENCAHPFVEDRQEEPDGKTSGTRQTRGTRWKMKRLIICSGPKDGMNAYFHSNAHVCWGMSETSMLTDAMIWRLRQIADEIFICYDIDKTGIRRMNEAALQHLYLKPVYLPMDLLDIRNPRTRKQCKDIAEYLNYYPTPSGRTIDYLFEGLLHNAISMKPWREIGARKNIGGGRQSIIKYEILVDAVAQYAPARGFYQYTPKQYNDDEQLGQFYMQVKDNKARIIDDAEMVLAVKNDIKNFLRDNYKYNNVDLRNTISTSKRIIPETIAEIQGKDVSFISWNKEECYFFFRNTAVRVTADSMEKVKYCDLPFFVNEKAIINYDFDYDGEELFDIEYNKDVMEKLTREHEKNLSTCKNEEEENIENKRYAENSRLWKYRLVLKRPMNDMPPAFQVLYDSGRVFWRQEKKGMPLTAEEKQTQDMHMMNKVMATGYMLDPYRDPTRIFIVVATDYNQYIQGKPSGRNLKSFVGGQLLPLVRNGYIIGGKDIKTRADKFAENFSGYELTEHSHMYMDDLKSNIDIEMLFNTGYMISKRRLYHDTVQIKGQWVPKVMISMNNNQVFDMSAPSIYERIWLTMHCDYYHAESEDGDMEAFNPMIKFGRQIIKDITDQERQETMWMLMKFCQIWKREDRDHYKVAVIRPPMESRKMAQKMRELIQDDAFIMWIREWFLDYSHYKVPIAIKEMVIDYLRFKAQNEGEDDVKISKDDVKYENVKKMKQRIRTYCEHLPYDSKIVCNPERLFGKEPDYKNEGGVVRKKVLVTQFVDGYADFSLPKVESVERCFFFYRMQDLT